MNAVNVTCFGVEHIPKEVRKFIGDKNIITHNDKIQAYSSIIYRYFCIGFIDFKFKETRLLDYTHLFTPNEY